MFLTHYPAAFWAAAITAVLLLGISKAGFAGGVGTWQHPLVALTITVAEAAAILLPLLIFTDILALFYYRRDFDSKSMRVSFRAPLSASSPVASSSAPLLERMMCCG